MKSTFTALALVAAAVAYPLQARTCTDGALVCNGSSQFGLCNAGSVVFMDVAAGTVCSCSGDSCTIEAATDGATGATSAAAALTPAATVASITSTVVANGAAVPSVTSIAFSTAEPSPAAPSTEAESPKVASTTTTQQAATSTAEVAQSAATSSTASSSSGSGGRSYISVFSGDGTTAEGWPAMSEWLDFETLWSTNLAAIISQSCTQFGQTNNSPDESANLKSAIQSVASSSGIDERFILAITMQESGGCVRAPTTNYGVVNPGLMQSHDGSHSCYSVSPCSSDEITGMIEDGSTGTSSGDGLKQCIAESGATDVSMYYKAARIYNSGSIAASGKLQDGIATHCYSSDVANRLLGWTVGTTSCSF